MSKTKEVAVPEEAKGGLPAAANDLDLSAYAGAGLESLDAKDYAIPYLGLIQGLSPQITPGKPKYIKGAAMGQFFLTDDNKLIDDQDDGIFIIPLIIGKFYKEWKPREAGGGLVNPNHKEEVLRTCQRGEKGEYILANGNIIVDSYDWFCLLIDKNTKQTRPVVISFKSTMKKKSRNMASQLNLIRWKNTAGQEYNPPIFAHIIKVSSIQESSGGNTWFNYNLDRVENPGEILSPEQYKGVIQVALAFQDQYRKGLVKVGEDSLDNAGGSTTDGDDLPF